MVITPGIQDLPYTIVNGRKFFELTAEEILWELVDGIVIRNILRFMFFPGIK